MQMEISQKHQCKSYRTYWIYKEIQAYDLANRATLNLCLRFSEPGNMHEENNAQEL